MKISTQLLLGTILLSFFFLNAHLCNDVFIQAKDNLAVKVDIRDGQLRISKEARFRVYLLNTMDRDIADIRLEIMTDKFKSKVKPASSWKSYPVLKTTCKGGSKQYFTVILKRKKDVPQGKYNIGLRLFNGKNKSQVFKTVDLAGAMSIMKVPEKPNSLSIDGKASRKEWGKGLQATSFSTYTYRKTDASWIDKEGINSPASVQTRVRFLHGKTSLFAFVDLKKPGTKKDKITMLISPDTEKSPAEIVIDAKKGIAEINGKKSEKVKVAKKGSKVEIEIPFKEIATEGKDSFYLNVIRSRDKEKSVWQGNLLSAEDPVVFARFVLE